MFRHLLWWVCGLLFVALYDWWYSRDGREKTLDVLLFGAVMFFVIWMVT